MLCHLLTGHRYDDLSFWAHQQLMPWTPFFCQRECTLMYCISVGISIAVSKFNSIFPIPYSLMSLIVNAYTSLNRFRQTRVSMPEPADWQNPIWRQPKRSASRNQSQQADSLPCLACSWVCWCSNLCIAIVYGSRQFFTPSNLLCLLITLEIQEVVLFVILSIVASLFMRSNFWIKVFASNRYFCIVSALILFDCKVCPIARKIA